MKGSEVVAALKKKFGVKNDSGLAEKLGVTPASVSQWVSRDQVTPRQLAEWIKKVRDAGKKEAHQTAIRPLVEFFPLEKSGTKQGVAYELFSIKSDKGPHQYLKGLREELEEKKGIYIFFDSRGQALYIGKAAKQSLWKEMNLAFNRDRGDVQKIKRVDHPSRMQKYKNSDEKIRQITPHTVPLCELATYFSAYDIADEMIGEVEALLVRSSANTLLNIKMERFGTQKKA
jgi:DNA-binding transcriptional regulator YdaS (Cro superfamily)